MPEDPELVPVVAIQAILSSKPEEPILILCNRIDGTLGEAFIGAQPLEMESLRGSEAMRRRDKSDGGKQGAEHGPRAGGPILFLDHEITRGDDDRTIYADQGRLST